MTLCAAGPPPVGDPGLGASYLALVPVIRPVVRGAVHNVPCPDRRDDLVAEAVALGWNWYRRLVARGRDPSTFPVAFAHMLGRSVRSGRRLARADSAGDVLSPTCRYRHGVTVGPLSADLTGHGFAHALAADARAPVPEQAAFRIDYPRWRASLSPARRRLLDLLAAGYPTGEAAAQCGVSAARVSQVRRELHVDWTAFCGDAPTAPAGRGR